MVVAPCLPACSVAWTKMWRHPGDLKLLWLPVGWVPNSVRPFHAARASSGNPEASVWHLWQGGLGAGVMRSPALPAGLALAIP